MAYNWATGTLSGAGGGALTGAAIGAAGGPIGMAGGAAIGAGVGLISGLFADQEANSKEAIARAQLEEAQRNRGLMLGEIDKYRQYAAPTIDELAALQRQQQIEGQYLQQQGQTLAYNKGLLERNLAMAQEFNPALKEMIAQTTKTLQGQESAMMSQVKLQRDRQRSELENRLRSQLGSGYATSTAGMQALARFDSETQSAMANTQMSALQALTNASAQTSQQMLGFGSAAQGGINAGGTIAAQGAELRNQLNLGYLGASNTLQNRQMLPGRDYVTALSQSSLVPYQGAEYAGNLVSARYGQDAMSGLMNAGMTYGLSSLNNSGSGNKINPNAYDSNAGAPAISNIGLNALGASGSRANSRGLYEDSQTFGSYFPIGTRRA